MTVEPIVTLAADGRHPPEVSGSAGFMSWRRLANEVMRASGELRSDEEVHHVVADPSGIAFYVRKRS